MAILLALVVVTGFLARAVVVRQETPANSAIEIDFHQTVDAFYTAMNTALSGGSTASLEAMLSPIFVDHDTGTAEERSAGAFLAGVRSAGASLQQIQFEVVSVEPEGKNLEVGIRLVHGGQIETAGMTIEQALPEPHFELLRIERGKIVDRWAPNYPSLGVFAPAEAPPKISGMIGLTTLLTRVDLAGSEERTWLITGVGIVLVSEGSVSLSISDGFGSQSIDVLEAGEFASIAGGKRARLRVASGDSASVLMFQSTRITGASEVMSPTGTDAVVQGGIVSLLWSGPLYWPGSNIVHSAVGIELPASSDIRVLRPGGSVLLIGANTGSVEASVADGSVVVLGDDRWPVIVDGPALLDADHGGWIGRDGTVSLRNLTDGPVTLMLVSIDQESPLGGSLTLCPQPCSRLMPWHLGPEGRASVR